MRAMLARSWPMPVAYHGHGPCCGAHLLHGVTRLSNLAIVHLRAGVGEGTRGESMDAITQCIEALSIGRPQAAESLIMIPLSRGAYQPRSYKVLEEAISDETASISEVSEGGSVPTLLFENKAARPVLLIDGDTLT